MTDGRELLAKQKTQLLTHTRQPFEKKERGKRQGYQRSIHALLVFHLPSLVDSFGSSIYMHTTTRTTSKQQQEQHQNNKPGEGDDVQRAIKTA